MGKYKTKITEYGYELINKALSGNGAIITNNWYIALGDGEIEPSNKTTRLNNIIFDKNSPDYPGIIISQDKNGRYAEIVLPESLCGCTIKEIGLFDEKNYLVAVANTKIDCTERTDEGFDIDYRARIGLNAIDKDVAIQFQGGTFQLLEEKGRSCGYAPLDNDAKVPLEHLPSTSDFSLFDIKTSDHILTGKEAFGWALQGTYTLPADTDFYNKCLEEKEAAAESIITVGNHSFTAYTNQNGHIYYDIGQKSDVDEIYDLTGVAWYYGIDEENQRVFLPRNDYFLQMTGNPNEAGKYIEAGLPNIKGAASSFWCGGPTNWEGAIYKTGKGTSYGGGTSSGSGFGFDASLSNPVYGASDTVQPKSTKMLLYICVGNVIADSAKINAQKLAGDVRNFENIKADKSQLDGPWVTIIGNSNIIHNLSLPVLNTSTTLEFDISNLLPADNNYYELSFECEIFTNKANNSYTNVGLYGKDTHWQYNSFGIKTPAANNATLLFSGSTLIAPNRKLLIKYYNSTAAGSINNVWVNKYRKKGNI